MAFARALVTLNNDSLVPADRVTNTWHFRTPGAVSAVGTALETLLDTFYTSIGGTLSSNLSGSGTVQLYDLEDPEPRAPVFTGAITFSPGASGYPNEVAVCMSFQGPIVSGFPQSRRRGRLFLGPMVGTAGSVSGGDYRVSAGTRTTIATAADTLMSDTTTPGLIWSVFSPTTAGPSPWSAAALGDAFVTVTNGWINDAFDTVRSRGLATTARTVWN